MLTRYALLLQKFPIFTQCGTTGILFGVGDVVAQTIQPQQEGLDWKRTGRMALYGLAIAGPSMSIWYKLLQTNINLSTRFKTLLARVAADQFVFAPTFISVFFTSQWYMNAYAKGQDASWSEASSALSKAYWPALINNYKLWPFVQLVNFYLVPLYYRTMVVNVVAIGWNAYLSMASHSV